MSGHSKWSTIKRQKGAADFKKGQLFTKIARAITITAKEGGGNPEANFRLRLIIDQARALNMPKENIERAIARASSLETTEKLEEVTYEGYGPQGVAFIIEGVTDNRQRTTQEIKSIVERSHGNLAGPGAVAWMFKKLGLLLVTFQGKSFDEAILEIIDLGVEDVEEAGEQLMVYTTPEKLEETRAKLVSLGYQILEAELTLKPTTTVAVNEKETAQKILSLVEKIEELEDVHKVYANFAVSDNLLKEIQQD